jgi:hypothetical protein
MLSCLPLRLSSQDEAAGESKIGVDIFEKAQHFSTGTLHAIYSISGTRLRTESAELKLLNFFSSLR